MGTASSLPARTRLLMVALATALVLSLLLAPGALADGLTPESGGSPNADKIDTLYTIVLVVAFLVWIGVTGTMLYTLARFRARKGATAAQIHGNTRLEIGWTVGAAVIIVALSIVAFAFLPGIKNPPNSDAGGYNVAAGAQFAQVDAPDPPDGKALEIKVLGRQFIWRYTYPDGDDNTLNDVYSYEEMVVPVDTTVILIIEATDVAHSWWIPKLGGKQDGVPGARANKTWFKISEPGVYEGQCAELCGRGHANMTARVRAVPVDEFTAWLDTTRQDIEAANKAAADARERYAPTAEQP